MDIKTLGSRNNLSLAWKRVASASNFTYKASYRPIFEAYELASKQALADLRERIIECTYNPQEPLKQYYPKPSGLQRPITYLVIEDQIILQAIANLFMNVTINIRRELEGRYIFSNYFNPKTSPFAVNQWMLGYLQLFIRFEQLYKLKNRWVVKFDLASFYDTISHDLLLRTIAPRGGCKNLTECVCNWLSRWSSSKAALQYSHGIPQGPVSSDILAECFLLPIDQIMARKFKYLRYVDDIFIFGKSESEVTQGLVSLDNLCRSRGLIPHVDKLGTNRLRNLRELRALIPRIDSYHSIKREKSLTESSSWGNINSSLDKHKEAIIDKSKFRYALFRAPKSDRILNLILQLWPTHPEHTDAIAAFLDQYSESSIIAEFASNMVRSSYPYDAVNGELWKLLSKFSSRSRLVSLIKRAINTFRSSTTEPATKIGTLIFLCRLHKLGIGRYASFAKHVHHPLIQTFIAPYLPVPLSEISDTVSVMLERTCPDTSLALTIPLQLSKINPNKLMSRNKHINPVAQAVYSSIGLIPPVHPYHHDRLGTILAKIFSIQNWPKWQLLLETEYAHAYSQIIMAKIYYESHYTPWLAALDVFNEIIFRAFQKYLSDNRLVGAIPTTHPNGELIDYGLLIRNNTLILQYPRISTLLQEIHTRRNRLPTSHPYDKKTGLKAIPLTRNERSYYYNKFSRLYDELINTFKNIGI
jgi:retron-type reverse transcriptase